MSPDNPKCMKCDQPATHKITKIVKGKVHDLFLCDDHARSISPYLQKDQSKLMELLQHFLKQQEELLNTVAEQTGGNREAEGAAAPSAVCPNCGLAFGAYRKTLLLGCSDCYAAFADLLTDDLRRMHGGATSQQPIPEGEAAGRVASEGEAAGHPSPPPPKGAKKAPSTGQERLAAARGALQDAIAREDFRRAAQLRDQIRVLETGMRRQAEDASAGGKAPTEEGGDVR